MKIVITGSIAFDYLMSFPGRFNDMIVAEHLENLSLSFLVDSMVKQRGGNAPNIAYTNALLGGHPTIMATAGRDFVEYQKWLDDQGIDTSAILVLEDDFTASFFVNTDIDQNQIASFYTGAMAHAGKLSFTRNAADADLAIISPNDPGAMRAYVRECKNLNIPYIYDPSQQTVRLTKDDLYEGLDGCHMLTLNAYEFHLIQERTGLSKHGFLDRVGALLVTSGMAGAELWVDGEYWHIPSVPPRKIIDPTGAGDAFRAGLLRGMELELTWDVAGRMGALAATYVLENFGTQSHHYSAGEFVTRFREHFDDRGELDKLN